MADYEEKLKNKDEEMFKVWLINYKQGPGNGDRVC